MFSNDTFEERIITSIRGAAVARCLVGDDSFIINHLRTMCLQFRVFGRGAPNGAVSLCSSGFISSRVKECVSARNTFIHVFHEIWDVAGTCALLRISNPILILDVALLTCAQMLAQRSKDHHDDVVIALDNLRQLPKRFAELLRHILHAIELRRAVQRNTAQLPANTQSFPIELLSVACDPHIE